MGSCRKRCFQMDLFQARPQNNKRKKSRKGDDDDDEDGVGSAYRPEDQIQLTSEEITRERRIGYAIVIIVVIFLALLIAAYRDTAYNPIKCVETSGCNSDVVESQSSTQRKTINFSSKKCDMSIQLEHFLLIENSTHSSIIDDPLRINDMSFQCSLN